jgi:carboxypeptidase family protein
MRPRLALYVVVGSMLLIHPAAWAQDASTGAIVGAVRDSSGGALPGVTVEVASPALIERVRSVVTDGEGRYRITALRPGAYTVTFTLTGFTTLKREGIDVQTGFAATVNTELAVGTLNETITVTGQAPLVDVTSTAQQTVFPQEVVRELPLGKNAGVFMAVIPGATTNAANIDVAGTKNEQSQNFTVHGGGTIVQLRDGIFVGLPLGGQNHSNSNNPAAVQEVNLQINGGLTAEAQGAGTQVNYIPRDGGNQFRGAFNFDFGAGRLQSDNVDDDLRARGATAPGKIKKLYDVNAGYGGPLLRDRIWFYSSARKLDNQSYVVGSYFNQSPNTLFYTPDLNKPAYQWTYVQSTMHRVTWQATPKDKITGSWDFQRNCNCYNLVSGGQIMPDGAGMRIDYPDNLLQLGYNRVVSSNLLVEGRYAYFANTVGNAFERPDPNWIAVFDQVNNRRYGALGGMGISGGNAYGYSYAQSIQGQGSVNYVTGSHNFKVGAQLRRMRQLNDAFINNDVTYVFNGSTQAAAARSR